MLEDETPSSVSFTLRVVRESSCTPSSASSRAMLLPAPEAVMPSPLAARAKLLASAARTNTRISSS